MRRRLSADEYVQGVLNGDRAVLGRAITLVESNHPDHQRLAQQVLSDLLPHTGGAMRVGLSGVPGVGKSTFLEHLGLRLVDRGHRVAVLAVDPSSTLSGGSILGDKTRMMNLSVRPEVFVRPSPTSGTLGGVHGKTRESMLICEAAGFDVVFVETVGVGQSETSVAQMVDTYLVLFLAGAGDDLQGIKRGILELADVLAINKADGDNVLPAQRARRDLVAALMFLRPVHAAWRPVVLTCSALRDEGLDEVWQAVLDHRATLEESGALMERRRSQRASWMWGMVESEVIRRLHHHPKVRELAKSLVPLVNDGARSPTSAARELLDVFAKE